MSPISRLHAYAGHRDPAAAMANVTALVIGGNGPFYPVYALAMIGHAGMATFLTMFATPFFLAIPALSRRSSLAGRLALPLLGTANTLWCMKLMGPDSGVAWFFLPCIALAALLFRREERSWMLLAIAAPLVAFFLPAAVIGTKLLVLTAADSAALARLNGGSVATLMGFLALKFAGLLRNTV
jgi:hypothetical protein